MDFWDTVLGNELAHAIIAENSKQQYTFTAQGEEALGNLIAQKIKDGYEYITHIKTGMEVLMGERQIEYLVIFRK